MTVQLCVPTISQLNHYYLFLIIRISVNIHNSVTIPDFYTAVANGERKMLFIVENYLFIFNDFNGVLSFSFGK